VKATRRRSIKFNLGNYEMYEVEAGIEFDTDVVDYDAIGIVLDNMLREDIERAKMATSYAKDDNMTSVYEFDEIIGGH
jgi:hypothetical protein